MHVYDPCNMGFNSLQLWKSLILSTSQWGSREKLRDLFKDTEKLWRMRKGSDVEKPGTELCVQSLLCLCHRANPPAEPPMQKEESWGESQETSHKNLHLGQKQDFFPWLSSLTAGRLLTSSSGFSKAQAYSKCSSWKTKEPEEPTLFCCLQL